MTALRRPRGVDDARLARRARTAPRHGGRLRLRTRRTRSPRSCRRDASVPGAPADLGTPGHGTAQSPVDLADADAVAETGHLAAVVVPAARRRRADESALGVTSRRIGTGGRQLAECPHVTPVRTSPPAASRAADHRVGDPLAAAFDKRPSDRVRERKEKRAEPARDRPVEGEHRVRRHAGDDDRAPRASRKPCTSRRAERRPLEGETAPRRAEVPRHGPHRGEDRVDDLLRHGGRTGRSAGGSASRRDRGTARGLLHAARRAATARSPPSGWAKASSGWSRGTPRAARSKRRKNGDAFASG